MMPPIMNSWSISITKIGDSCLKQEFSVLFIDSFLIKPATIGICKDIVIII